MTATIRDVVDDAQQIVGEVAGPGVQTYSDDRMFGDAIRAFNTLFKKYNWRQYCTWQQLTLDGVTGTVTSSTALTNVVDFEDFIVMRRQGTNSLISVMPRDVNPFEPRLLSGSTPIYWDSLNAVIDSAIFVSKRVRFYPMTATGQVNIFARYYPKLNEAWDWSDTMFMDRDMLAYMTAYKTLSSDDLNPGAADACREDAQDRYKDIVASLSSHEIIVRPSIGIPQNWTDAWGIPS